MFFFVLKQALVQNSCLSQAMFLLMYMNLVCLARYMRSMSVQALVCLT